MQMQSASRFQDEDKNRAYLKMPTGGRCFELAGENERRFQLVITRRSHVSSSEATGT
jgi:hypothetical protein